MMIFLFCFCLTGMSLANTSLYLLSSCFLFAFFQSLCIIVFWISFIDTMQRGILFSKKMLKISTFENIGLLGLLLLTYLDFSTISCFVLFITRFSLFFSFFHIRSSQPSLALSFFCTFTLPSFFESCS